MNPFYYSWTAQNSAVDFPVESALGDEFILQTGDRVYDFVSTSFQTNFGHSHPKIIEAVSSQLGKMPIASPKSTFDLKTRVAEKLTSLLNLDQGKIFFTVSGSESVENALKIARQFTGRKIVLARQKSYHGASLGALSVTGDWRNGPHLTFDEGTVRMPEHDADPELNITRRMVTELGGENIAAVILETISGTNGMSVPPLEWFQEVQSLCHEHGILLILDEVLVGFGRCGPPFAFHMYGLTPDIVTMSKAISGGYIPFGAVWTSSTISQKYDDEVLCCGLTNYGHPLGLAATEAVVDLLQEQEFQNHKNELENSFKAHIDAIGKLDAVKEVRTRGLMARIDLHHNAPSWQRAFDAGLHLFSRDNWILLAPPYVSTKQRLAESLDKLCGFFLSPQDTSTN